VFANPRPTAAALAQYYSKPSKFDAWLDEESERNILWKRRLKIMNSWKKPGSLLDVGAGIGQLLAHAKHDFTEVYGTEISDSAMAIAQNKYGVQLIKGQLEDIQFDRTFDNVSLFHILEHVPNPRSFLEKCASLLSPGGRIFIGVPNDLLSWELKSRTAFKRLRRRLPPHTGPLGLPKIQLDGSVDEIHLSQFTPASLNVALAKAGFRVIESTLDPYFAKKGLKLRIHQLYYHVHLTLHRLFRTNHYNTIFVIAEKI